MVGKNGAGQTPKKALPKKKTTAKKSVILGKNGAGQTPKKFLPKKKTTAKKPVKAGKKSTWKPKRSPKNFLKMNKAAVKTKKTKKALRRLFKVKSYPNASDGLDINKPVRTMKNKHAVYRHNLSHVVKNIQTAYDGAKKNNARAIKLRSDEKESLRSVNAALVAVKGEEVKSAAIRKDKTENFPALPKEALNIK